VVYELAKSGGTRTESVVYDFFGYNGDGSFPVGSVIFDKKSSAFYGLTSPGGNDGRGTVYQVVLP
jgi:hypothetical protein